MQQKLTPYILFLMIPIAAWIIGTQMRPTIQHNFDRHVEISDVQPIEKIRGVSAGKPVDVHERKEIETYTVQRGDSWSSISRKRGLNMQALMDANPNLKATGLKVGDVVLIPTNIQER